jgi:hypothetical protein
MERGIAMDLMLYIGCISAQLEPDTGCTSYTKAF